MHCFVLRIKPRSYNSWKHATDAARRSYATSIKLGVERFCSDYAVVNTNLYGVVYHFYQTDTGIDADNLSKPLWDCLKGVLFSDDKQVKLRIAGSFDLKQNDFTFLDFSGLTGEVVTELLQAFDTEQHILYVECGNFEASMVKLNMSRDGN